MGVHQGAGGNGSSRRRGRPARLPVIATTNRDEAAAVLDQHDDLLRERAVQYLGVGTAEVDEVIARTRFRVLSEHADSSHALRDTLRVLRDVCRVVLARRAREPEEWTRKRAAGVPVDAELGPIEGATKEAAERLTALQRNRLYAATIKSHDEVAHDEGLSVTVFRRRLYQARQRVRTLLQREGRIVPAYLLAVVRRLRTSAAQAIHLPSAAALAPALMLSLFGGAQVQGPAGPAYTPPGPMAMAAVGSRSGAATTNAGLTARPGAVQAIAPPPSSSASPAIPPADTRSWGSLPLAPDPPETTDVRSVAWSPHYEQDHTIVALGLGHECACSVLLRSTDGGASWQSMSVAASGDQVALPSDFPTDGRIFIGAEPSATSVDWVSAGWGQPFAPLPLPPSAAGHLAIIGDRVLSVGTEAVWSLRAGTSGAVPLLLYSGQPATLATTPYAVFILVPPHTLSSDAVVGTEPGLFGCAPDCRYVGAVPLPAVGPLAVSGTTVIAAAGATVVMSPDGGRTFQSIAPAKAPQVDAVAVDDMATWIVGQEGAERRSVEGGGWQRVPVEHVAVREVVPLPGRRLIATLQGAGVRCSADGGATWVRRCAPQA